MYVVFGSLETGKRFMEEYTRQIKINSKGERRQPSQGEEPKQNLWCATLPKTFDPVLPGLVLCLNNCHTA